MRQRLRLGRASLPTASSDRPDVARSASALLARDVCLGACPIASSCQSQLHGELCKSLDPKLHSSSARKDVSVSNNTHNLFPACAWRITEPRQLLATSRSQPPLLACTDQPRILHSTTTYISSRSITTTPHPWNHLLAHHQLV